MVEPPDGNENNAPEDDEVGVFSDSDSDHAGAMMDDDGRPKVIGAFQGVDEALLGIRLLSPSPPPVPPPPPPKICVPQRLIRHVLDPTRKRTASTSLSDQYWIDRCKNKLQNASLFHPSARESDFEAYIEQVSNHGRLGMNRDGSFLLFVPQPIKPVVNDVNVNVNFFRTPPVIRNQRNNRIDYITEYGVPSLVLRIVASFFNKKDLLSFMHTCRRFYHIGITCEQWEYADFIDANLSVRRVIHLLNMNMKAVRLAFAKVANYSILEEGIIKVNEENVLSSQLDKLITLRPMPTLQVPLVLTHLDLSRTVFEDQNFLKEIMNGCEKLIGLSLHQQCLDDNICLAISSNTKLKYLDISMVTGLTNQGAELIVKNCTNLLELNVSWCQLSPEQAIIIMKKVTPKLTHLSISGTAKRKGFKDEDVIELLIRCPLIVGLDMADNTLITDEIIPYIAKSKVRDLDISRCVDISLTSCRLLQGRLDRLNVWGDYDTTTVAQLKKDMAPTIVNADVSSDIAKPTIYPHNSSIWQQKTKDLY